MINLRYANIFFLQKTFILKSGGNCPKDNVQRVLKKTFTNECAMKCSWMGLRNNFCVGNLHIIKIIKSTYVC